VRMLGRSWCWGLCLFGVQVALLSANEALDFLEAELGEEEWADQGSVEEVGKGEKKEVRPVLMDPSLPGRWDPELMALLPVKIAQPGAEEVALRGLYEWRMDHGDLDIEGGPDGEVDSSRSRRMRLGVALKTFYEAELQADVLFDGEADYAGIETLLARVPVGDSLLVSAGKFPPPFTLEYTQDAAVRWTRELSPLVAQMVPASSLGVMVQGQGARWDWKLGWFSGDADRDVPSWCGQGYLLAGLGYSGYGAVPVGAAAGTASWTRWHLDYIYNFDGAESRSVPMGYEHLLATGVQVSSGRFDLMNDFLLAHGETSRAWGMTMTGGYWLMEDALRLVTRFDYAKSGDEGGILSGWGIPTSGSEAAQPFSYPTVYRGGELFSIYGGLDLHLSDRNLILSSGLELRTLSDVVGSGDIQSLIWQTGGRVAF